jgi:hypothetical protein
VVSHAGQTQIIDFGVAQRGRPTPAQAALRPGKVSYMSPEQVRGQPLDPRSDLFSLGTILYEITLGRRLWRGPAEVVMRRIVEEAVVPPTYVQRDYPPALERIVLRALEKRPQDRQASAADMLADLDSFLADVGVAHTSLRTLGEYVRAIYAPGAKVSERGAQRAQIFQDDDGVVVDPENAPLDFDRALARPGSGAALAHALRGAEPFELAADVTAVSAGGIPGLGAGAAVSPSVVAPGSARTPPPVSLRTPPPISLRNGAGAVSGAASESALAPPAAQSIPIRGAGSGPESRSFSGRARVVLIGVLLTILLGGIFFVLRSS